MGDEIDEEAFKTEAFKRISLFLKEIQAESDRGAAIFAAAFFDSKLKEILKNYLKKSKTLNELLDGPNAALGTFSAKMNMCYSLGLLTEHEFSELRLIKKIRNDFAHKFEFEFSFSDKKIADICLNFRASTPGEKISFHDNPRFLFINAVILLHNSLYYREIIAGLNKIEKKDNLHYY